MQSDSQSITELVKQFKKGLYEHCKGNEYQVIDLVRHSESDEWLVLYQPCYGERALWVRPISMFFENVEVEPGKWVERFKLKRSD